LYLKKPQRGETLTTTFQIIQSTSYCINSGEGLLKYILFLLDKQHHLLVMLLTHGYNLSVNLVKTSATELPSAL